VGEQRGTPLRCGFAGERERSVDTAAQPRVAQGGISMHQRRWLFMAVALALAGFALSGLPAPAHAQGSAAEGMAVPRDLASPSVAAAFGPGAGRFISTVDNFAGIGAVANIQGTGKDNKGNSVTWEVDARGFQGVWVDPNGFTYRGTWGFA
jgi:hypothetical protein